MREKIEIKYLVSGTVSVDKPAKWEGMSDEDKRNWADKQLEESSDSDLVEGLMDSGYTDKIWDETPEVSAIVDPTDDNYEYSLLTKTWCNYVYGSCGIGRLVCDSNRLVRAEELE